MATEEKNPTLKQDPGPKPDPSPKLDHTIKPNVRNAKKEDKTNNGEDKPLTGGSGGVSGGGIEPRTCLEMMKDNCAIISGAAATLGIIIVIITAVKFVIDGVQNSAPMINTINNQMFWPPIKDSPEEVNLTIEFNFHPPIPGFENWTKLEQFKSKIVSVPRSFFTNDQYWLCIRWKDEVKIFQFSGASSDSSYALKQNNEFKVHMWQFYVNGKPIYDNQYHWEYREIRANQNRGKLSPDDAAKEVRRLQKDLPNLCVNSSNSSIQKMTFYFVTMFVMFFFTQ